MKFRIENASNWGKVDVYDFKKLKEDGFQIDREGEDEELNWILGRNPGRKYCSSTIEITDINQIIRIMELTESSVYFEYDKKGKDLPTITIVDDWLS